MTAAHRTVDVRGGRPTLAPPVTAPTLVNDFTRCAASVGSRPGPVEPPALVRGSGGRSTPRVIAAPVLTRQATGARRCRVFTITSLASDGSRSVRWAISFSTSSISGRYGIPYSVHTCMMVGLPTMWLNHFPSV